MSAVDTFHRIHTYLCFPGDAASFQTTTEDLYMQHVNKDGFCATKMSEY